MFESMDGLARGITRTLAKPFIEVAVNQDITGQSDPGVQKVRTRSSGIADKSPKRVHLHKLDVLG
jgi:hypothetical protein